MTSEINTDINFELTRPLLNINIQKFITRLGGNILRSLAAINPLQSQDYIAKTAADIDSVTKTLDPIKDFEIPGINTVLISNEPYSRLNNPRNLWNPERKKLNSRFAGQWENYVRNNTPQEYWLGNNQIELENTIKNAQRAISRGYDRS